MPTGGGSDGAAARAARYLESSADDSRHFAALEDSWEQRRGMGLGHGVPRLRRIPAPGATLDEGEAPPSLDLMAASAPGLRLFCKAGLGMPQPRPASSNPSDQVADVQGRRPMPTQSSVGGGGPSGLATSSLAVAAHAAADSEEGMSRDRIAMGIAGPRASAAAVAAAGCAVVLAATSDPNPRHAEAPSNGPRAGSLGGGGGGWQQRGSLEAGASMAVAPEDRVHAIAALAAAAHAAAASAATDGDTGMLHGGHHQHHPHRGGGGGPRAHGVLSLPPPQPPPWAGYDPNVRRKNDSSFAAGLAAMTLASGAGDSTLARLGRGKAAACDRQADPEAGTSLAFGGPPRNSAPGRSSFVGTSTVLAARADDGTSSESELRRQHATASHFAACDSASHFAGGSMALAASADDGTADDSLLRRERMMAESFNAHAGKDVKSHFSGGSMELVPPTERELAASSFALALFNRYADDDGDGVADVAEGDGSGAVVIDPRAPLKHLLSFSGQGKSHFQPGAGGTLAEVADDGLAFDSLKRLERCHAEFHLNTDALHLFEGGAKGGGDGEGGGAAEQAGGGEAATGASALVAKATKQLALESKVRAAASRRKSLSSSSAACGLVAGTPDDTPPTSPPWTPSGRSGGDGRRRTSDKTRGGGASSGTAPKASYARRGSVAAMAGRGAASALSFFEVAATAEGAKPPTPRPPPTPRRRGRRASAAGLHMLGGQLGGVVGGDAVRNDGRRAKVMRAREAAEAAEANRLVVASVPGEKKKRGVRRVMPTGAGGGLALLAWS